MTIAMSTLIMSSRYLSRILSSWTRKQIANYCTAKEAKDEKLLTLKNLNKNIIKLQYAVRGPLMIRAAEIEKELAAGKEKPFKEVIRANLGDAHAMGQISLTFIREVLACVAVPELNDSNDFPLDVRAKACYVLSNCRGNSIGAYTESSGIDIIRKDVACFIDRRDGVPSDWENIYLGNGASDCIRSFLKMFIGDVGKKKPGVMIPIPQYPLYSATLAEYGLEQIDYYLDEENNWGISIEELERAFKCAKGIPKVIVVINPGNPTGQVLTKDNIEEIICFAQKNKLYIMADEVYQENIWAEESEFHSFKKVMAGMGEPYSAMELVSFNSCSKGFVGECGIRSGYMEWINMDPQVKAMYMKAISALLCPNTFGQTVLECYTNPPIEGDPSYDCYCKEREHILSELKCKAEMIVEVFRKMDGFTCNPVQGAMYCFPKFEIPPSAIECALKSGHTADQFYAMELLNSTGICVIPGSGFGQKPDTYHFRTTIMPPKEMLKTMLQKLQEFHKSFLETYK